MNKKFGIKEVVAMGIGTALFVVLTNVQIPLVFIPNTALQPRMAVLAFFSAIFGPIVGGVVGFLGHALGDALFYGSVWWSWVFPEAVVGVAIGIFAKKYGVEEGKFVDAKAITFFNVVQVVANAFAWIVVAPVLDIRVPWRYHYHWYPGLTSSCSLFQNCRKEFKPEGGGIIFWEVMSRSSSSRM